MHVNILCDVRLPLIQITLALIVQYHLSDRMLKECKVKQQSVSS